MLHSHSPSPSRFPFNTNSNDSKTENIVKNFYIKTAQTIIQSRQQQQQQAPQQNESIDNDDEKKRMNRWFNMNTREYPDSLRSELKYWITRAFVSPITQPPPLIIEIYLDISNIPPGKQLALQNGWKIIDLDLIRSSFHPSSHSSSSSSTTTTTAPKKRIVLENWVLTLNHPLPTQTLDLGNVYKRSIIFFRTLYAFTRLLPIYNNTYQRRTMSNATATDGQQFIIDNIGYRLTSSTNNTKEDEIGLDEGPDANTTTQDLDSILTPLGTLGLRVNYRTNCNFIIHDSLNISNVVPQQQNQQTDSSTQLMDLDHNYFTPTIAKYNGIDRTVNLSDDDKDGKENENTFKTITKAVNKRTVTTQWPPVPRKSESARVATTTVTATSLSQYHHQRRQSYNNRCRPSSSSPKYTTHSSDNVARPRSLSLRPLSMNDGDTLFVKSAESSSISPHSSSRLHHVSPFKSPTLSSSSQHSSTFSLRSIRGATDDDKNSTKSNITHRFSSSFDYRHTDRYYHSAPSGGNESIQGSSSSSSRTRSRRSFSVARRPSVVADEDKELEEFVRSLNLQQTPGFQSRMLNEEIESNAFNDTYGTSLDISASYYRSKKALAHFQNLRGAHDSLSQSLISSSTILPSPRLEQQTNTTEATKETQLSRATSGDFDSNSNSNLLSSSLSRGSLLSRLSYQPRSPSPLHTEPPVSPIKGQTPVRIPSTQTATTTTHQQNCHDSNNNSANATTTTSPADNVDNYNSVCSSSNEHNNNNSDPYPPFMQSSFQRSGNTHNELTQSSHKRRSSVIVTNGNNNMDGQQQQQQQQQERNAFLTYNEIRRTTQLSINTESASSSSGGLDKGDDDDEDEQSISPTLHDEDDDSLVFKMSELGLYEHNKQ